jgi:hypothetical protein
LRQHREPFLRQNVHGPVYGNPHDPFVGIDPGVSIEELIFRRAHLLHVARGAGLETRFRRQLRRRYIDAL